MSVGAVTAGALVALTLAALAVIGWGAWDLDQRIEQGLLPAGTRIAGVDVGELDREAALAAVEEAVAPQLDRSVEVTYGDDGGWGITARDAGAASDAADVVDAIHRRARRLGWIHLARTRWLGHDPGLEHEVSVDLPRETVDRFVGSIADQVDLEPVDAELDHSTGWIEIVDARDGRRVDQQQLAGQVHAALLGEGGEIEAPVEVLEPEVRRDAYEHVVLVRQGLRRVYLYEDGEQVRSWPVAVGKSGSRTPTGVFTVGTKRHSPTWVNPDPTGWGSGMPARIGPGRNNPLGLRAINWHDENGNDTLIRFHGTPNVGSIGSAASQGCVRMTNSSVIELYDRAPTGATIVSLW